MKVDLHHPESYEPPHNLEAEQIVLGALLIKNNKLHEIGDFLRPEHFYEPLHSDIYQAIERSVQKGMIANPVTLRHQFDKHEVLEAYGGAQYLARLAASAGLTTTVAEYATAVHDLYLRRELVDLSKTIHDRAHGKDHFGMQKFRWGELVEAATAKEVIEKTEQELFNLASSSNIERRAITIGDALTQSLQRVEKAISNRGQEISEISMGLKSIAKELDIPVIALAELSRAVEQREDKRPQLSDLRESGSIEQDADVVMFVYREEYYLARTQPQPDSPKFVEWQAQMERCQGVADVIIAKQRHGPIGTEQLAFQAETTKFYNLIRE